MQLQRSSRLGFCHTGTLTLDIVTQLSGSGGIEAYIGLLASFSAFMLLVGSSDL